MSVAKSQPEPLKHAASNSQNQSIWIFLNVFSMYISLLYVLHENLSFVNDVD